MGALFTCCRRPKTPTGSMTNVGVVNEEVNIRNGEVVVESRTETTEAKYAYTSPQVKEKIEIEKEEGGEVVEETVEIKANRAVHAAPPVRPAAKVEISREPANQGTVFETETTTVSGGRAPGTEFQKTTIVRETVETRTVNQRSSIPTLKPAGNQESKPRPKVTIVREY